MSRAWFRAHLPFAPKYVGTLEDVPGTFHIDVGNLTAAEQEELAGFVRPLEAGTPQEVLAEPNLTRFVYLRGPVMWILD